MGENYNPPLDAQKGPSKQDDNPTLLFLGGIK